MAFTLLNAYGAPLNPAPAPARAAVNPAPAPAPTGRAPTYPGAAVITVNVANPKSGASRARYALYGAPGNSLTVAAYIAAGGRRADIAWDVARGFITVSAPSA